MEKAFSTFSGGGLSALFKPSSSSQGNIMQSGASALSVLSSISAARVARQEGDAEAGMKFFAAGFARDEAAIEERQEFIAGKARSAELLEDLVSTIGGQRVAFASSGTDGSLGTAAKIQEQTSRRGAEDLRLSRLQALIRGSTAKRKGMLEAATLETEGKIARAKGGAKSSAALLDAGQTIFNTGADIARRGGK